MNYYVYILANKLNTTIYTGVTKDLIRRVYEHRHHLDPTSFTAKYDVTRLVYYEATTDIRAAIEREKQIKSWNRARKKSPGGKHESTVGRSVGIDTILRERIATPRWGSQ